MGAAGCAAAAALIWIAVAFSASARWLDVAADHGFFDLQRPALMPIAQAVAHSMDPAVLVLAAIALVAVALVRGRPRVAVAVPLILIGANVTTQLLKPALAYPRFSEWLGDRQLGDAGIGERGLEQLGGDVRANEDDRDGRGHPWLSAHEGDRHERDARKHEDRRVH